MITEKPHLLNASGKETEKIILIKGLIQIGLIISIPFIIYYTLLFSLSENTTDTEMIIWLFSGSLVLIATIYSIIKLRHHTNLSNEKKEKIHKMEHIIISSRRSEIMPIILTIISGVLVVKFVIITFLIIYLLIFYWYIDLSEIGWFSLYLAAVFMTYIIYSGLRSARLQGDRFFIKHFLGREKQLNIADIDEIVTIGFFITKYMMIRYHENGKEKIIFILHPTIFNKDRDSYQALLYAHYYYKNNIKIY